MCVCVCYTIIPVCGSHSPGSGCSPASSCGSAGRRCGFCCGGGCREWTPAALRSACASWWGSGSHCAAGWWSGPRGRAALPKRTIYEVLLVHQNQSLWSLQWYFKLRSCDHTWAHSTCWGTQWDEQVDFEWGLFCDYITLSHDPSSGCRPDVNVCMQTMHVSMFLKPKLNSLTTYTSLIILMSLHHIYHFQRLTCFCYIVTVLTLILSVH